MVDLFDPESFSAYFSGDELYCCIGTTKAKTPDKNQYRKIDFEIPVLLGQLCKQHKIGTYLVISALGANPNSSIFYSRVKGEMEEAVLQMGIQKTYILQPSLIDSKREERRIGEYFFIKVMKLVNPLLIGKFKKYQSIPANSIADAMIWLANHTHSDKRISSEVIQKLARKYREND
ncbi:nucleoside-diphosphate sugar epimerase [Aquimarina sp. ERC-38]|uniref:nucleoside-diphosphate sugar epimerase n=1 Tax=Aquimarina sp. ERC-38 TaxID=2949996 RepID=UPI002AF6AD50|nr:nucleoside-diphosphate sugar epimerase [Aquimarina sp. ERC-38]